MKQSIFAIAALIFSLGINAVSAQAVNFKTALKQATDSNMSAVLDQKGDAITYNSKSQSAKNTEADARPINEKARKTFSKKFPGVINEFWETNDEGSSAAFNTDKAHNTIFYDKKGNWKAQIKSYEEDQLPLAIRQTVLSEYYDASIKYAHEILTTLSDGEPTYLIQLEDKYNLFEVRYHDGNMETWKQYKKQQ